MRLHSLLCGAHSYLPPPAILSGLTHEDALRRPADSLHSIAELVAHMAFWQDWFLNRCDGVATPPPLHAEASWPVVASVRWGVIHERFEAGFTRALALSDVEGIEMRAIVPPLEFGSLQQYTVGDALTHLAIHNAHHLGQVIALRQQIGAWPPAEGSWTW